MIRHSFWVIAGSLLSLTGSVATRAQTAASGAPQTELAKNLPLENDVARFDSVGDLLTDCAKKQPADADLSWFTALPAKQQEQVVNELNRYTFSFRDHVKVKARIKDDYDMRWTFTQPKPLVEIRQPAKATGMTNSLEVGVKGCELLAHAKEEDDRRQLSVTIDWKPAQGAKSESLANLSAKECRFTASFDFDATPKSDNHVVRNVDALDGIKSVKLLDDGSVMLTIEPSKGTFTTKLWVKGAQDYSDQATIKPGDYVGLVLVDALGAGSCGYIYRGVQNGHLRFEEHTWFYEVIEATTISLDVAPYDGKIKDTK